MAAGLTGDLIAIAMKERREPLSVETAWELHAGMTSSFTRWRRMSRGVFCGSKWQRTASCTMDFSSSRVSVCVQIEKPRARASYPPSGDAWTLKMISLSATVILTHCNYTPQATFAEK